MRRIPTAVLLAAAGALLAAGSALADSNGGFAPRDPASPGAGDIRDVYWLLVAIGSFVFAVVAIPLTIFLFRFRSRGRGREVEGPQIRGNSSLEIGWTLGAVGLVTIVIAFVFYKLPGIVDPGQAAGDGFTVKVEGRQFYWRYVYPNGVVAFDTVRLPLDREVTFAVSAPDGDVIHSFWVPNLAGKRDAIPGTETEFRVVPTKTGTFDVICAEFCGLQHATMRGSVEVLPAAAFDRWLSDQEQRQTAASAELGGSMWTSVCAKCHGPSVAGKIGPKLEGNPLLADREALAQIVRNGRRKMPAVGQGWTDEEVDSLVEFTKALAGGGGGGGQG
ncbi:MAG TPA: cytochrome c oxidase subunit II [Gaiellaceae bacterium]|nr:cytochrome c oxidase subunit II [Gaiellaceae bacterium]